MDKPLVSVVIPVYNAELYIASALQSVKEQTYPLDKIEIICVDDGSTDASAKVIRVWKNSDGKDINVSLLEKENGGSASARNCGIKHAAGDIIQLLDADDVLLPEKIEKSVEKMLEDESVGIVYSYYYQLGENNQREFVDRRPFSITGMIGECIVTTACMFRKVYYNAVGGYDENFKLIEDYDFYCKLAMICKVVCVEEPLFLYRQEGQNKTKTDVTETFQWHKEHSLVKRKLAKKLGDHNPLKIVTTLAGGIGDLVAISPAYKMLKEMYPDSEIVHYCYEKPFSDVLEFNPNVDFLHSGGNLIDMIGEAQRKYPNHKLVMADYFYKYGWDFWKTPLNLMQFLCHDVVGMHFPLDDYQPEFYFNPDGSDFEKPEKLAKEIGKFVLIEGQTRSNKEGKEWKHFEEIYNYLEHKGVTAISSASPEVPKIEGYKNIINVRDFTIREAAALIKMAEWVIVQQSGQAWISQCFNKKGVQINIGAPHSYAGCSHKEMVIVDQKEPFSPNTVSVEEVIFAIEKFV